MKSSAAKEPMDAFYTLAHVMQDMMGVVVGEDRNNIVTERLIPFMEDNGFATFDDLAMAMQDEAASDLRANVLQTITSHEARWFDHRDIESLLRDYVLPNAANQNRSDFKIWLVGCADGQFAYSLAMIIDEFRSDYGMAGNVEIIATDVSDATVQTAIHGRYHETELGGLSDRYRKRYLRVDDGMWRVDEGLRSMIHFSPCNLLGALEMLGSFDVIICPEELLYFANSVKSKILDEFANMLEGSGMLIVGRNEAVTPFSDRFEMVNHESGVFYRQITSA